MDESLQNQLCQGNRSLPLAALSHSRSQTQPLTSWLSGSWKCSQPVPFRAVWSFCQCYHTINLHLIRWNILIMALLAKTTDLCLVELIIRQAETQHRFECPKAKKKKPAWEKYLQESTWKCFLYLFSDIQRINKTCQADSVIHVVRIRQYKEKHYLEICISGWMVLGILTDSVCISSLLELPNCWILLR